MSEKTKAYRVRRPYYRSGAYFNAGSVVHIPESEKPGKGWTPVADDAKAEAMRPMSSRKIEALEKAEKAKVEVKPETPKADAKRPSDRTI